VAWSGRSYRYCEAATAQAEEDHELVHRALTRLGPEVRSLLVLRYFMDFDASEIGRIMGLPGSTVRGQLREARKQLAWELKRAGYRHE
jgi:RNA polymerase sigma factor (sigma-70 family)